MPRHTMAGATRPRDGADEHWVRRCLELARQSLDAGETPVGALVVRDGVVLGEGRERTLERLDPGAHAEAEAVRAACGALGDLDLSGATLYTTVEPCVLCAYVARRTRIARVVFGAFAGAVGAVAGTWPVLSGAAAFSGAPPDVRGGVLAEECNRLLGERRRERESGSP